MWKRFVKDYLSFTRKERLGIFTLLFLIIICIFLPFFYPYFIHTQKYDYSKFDKEIAQLKIQQHDSGNIKKSFTNNFDADSYTNNYEPSEKNYSTKAKVEEFYFDPNTVSSSDWKRLGLRDNTIATISKYLSKGGHFYKPVDLQKIWGLKSSDLERLLPYIRIENTEKQYGQTNAYGQYKPGDNSTPPATKYLPKIIDINMGDTTDFITLPGIGSKLANRIVTFRDKLGGFYSVDQVRETFGLPDSTFQKIKSQLSINFNPVKQININTASLNDMKLHPYIRYAVANAIIQYRTQHGNFASVEEIKKIMIITDDIYRKLFPYIIAIK